MQQTINAVYDGLVLVPENGVSLVPGKKYQLIVQPFHDKPESQRRESAWDLLVKLTGTVEGPEDWAGEIDHYLYGTPKRNRSHDQ